MGSLCQTQASSTSSTPSAYAQALYGSVAKYAQEELPALSKLTGPNVAGFNQEENQGVSDINAASGIAAPYYSTGSQELGTGFSTLANAGSTYLPAASNLAGAYAMDQVDPTKFSASEVNKYLSPYTQDVVASTEAQLNNQNAIQASNLTGSAIMGGNAFGGDRAGVAQAVLAGQQQTAEAPTIANLYNQGYSQALGEFNTQQSVDLSAAQQNRQALANASNLFSGLTNTASSLGTQEANIGSQTAALGSAQESTALAAAQAQLSAGQTQQATTQNQLNSDYQTQLNAMGLTGLEMYSQIADSIAGSEGGTSTTSGGSPSWLSQLAGVGTTAAGIYGLAKSDERVKEAIEPIGKTFDDQTIYRFRYRGDPRTQVGLIAQDVERKHPSAVGSADGIKLVDYDRATRRAADRGHFDQGGGVESEFDRSLSWARDADKQAAGLEMGVGYADGGSPGDYQNVGIGAPTSSSGMFSGQPTGGLATLPNFGAFSSMRGGHGFGIPEAKPNNQSQQSGTNDLLSKVKTFKDAFGSDSSSSTNLSPAVRDQFTSSLNMGDNGLSSSSAPTPQDQLTSSLDMGIGEAYGGRIGFGDLGRGYDDGGTIDDGDASSSDSDMAQSAAEAAAARVRGANLSRMTPRPDDYADRVANLGRVASLATPIGRAAAYGTAGLGALGSMVSEAGAPEKYDQWWQHNQRELEPEPARVPFTPPDRVFSDKEEEKFKADKPNIPDYAPPKMMRGEDQDLYARRERRAQAAYNDRFKSEKQAYEARQAKLDQAREAALDKREALLKDQHEGTQAAIRKDWEAKRDDAIARDYEFKKENESFAQRNKELVAGMEGAGALAGGQLMQRALLRRALGLHDASKVAQTMNRATSADSLSKSLNDIRSFRRPTAYDVAELTGAAAIPVTAGSIVPSAIDTFTLPESSPMREQAKSNLAFWDPRSNFYPNAGRGLVEAAGTGLVGGVVGGYRGGMGEAWRQSGADIKNLKNLIAAKPAYEQSVKEALDRTSKLTSRSSAARLQQGISDLEQLREGGGEDTLSKSIADLRATLASKPAPKRRRRGDAAGGRIGLGGLARGYDVGGPADDDDGQLASVPLEDKSDRDDTELSADARRSALSSPRAYMLGSPENTGFGFNPQRTSGLDIDGRPLPSGESTDGRGGGAPPARASVQPSGAAGAPGLDELALRQPNNQAGIGPPTSLAAPSVPPTPKRSEFDENLAELRSLIRKRGETTETAEDRKKAHEQNLSLALMAAGFGMMSGRSRNALVNIGEGGLAGLQSYQQGLAGERQDAKERQAEQRASVTDQLAVSRLEEEAREHKRKNDLEDRGKLETGMRWDATGNMVAIPGGPQDPAQKELLAKAKVTAEAANKGYLANPDGTWSPIVGGPADPEQQKKSAEAKRPAGTAFTDDTVKLMGDAIDSGNTRVLTNLGAGVSKAENVTRVWNYLSDKYKKEGLTGGDLSAKFANFQAQVGAAKSAAVREASVASNVEEAQRTFPLALDAMRNVPRTSFVPFNQLINLVESKTGSEAQRRLYVATEGVITAYSQAMARAGVATVDSRHVAQSLLNSADSPEAYEGAIDQMRKEMEAAEIAPEAVRQAILSRISGRPVQPVTSGAMRPSSGGQASPNKATAPDVLSQARKALSLGAPRDKVIEMLKQKGIDPSGL